MATKSRMQLAGTIWIVSVSVGLLNRPLEKLGSIA